MRGLDVAVAVRMLNPTIRLSLLCLLGFGCGHDAPAKLPVEAPAPAPVTAPVAAQPAPDPDLIIETITSIDLDTKLARLCGIDDSRIYFKFDSAKLRPESKQTLDQIATCAISGSAKGTHLRVVGRTDPRGTDSYNKTLGMTRADSVAAYLKGDGLKDTRMETLSKGEADADPSSSGWPFDRRVTVRLDQ